VEAGIEKKIFMTTARRHGDFDDDQATVRATLARMLGTEELAGDFTITPSPRHAASVSSSRASRDAVTDFGNPEEKEDEMAEAKRVQLQEARSKVQAGEALFVCAYDSEEMCGGIRLEKALTLGELNARLPEIPKEQEIIFYCQ